MMFVQVTAACRDDTPGFLINDVNMSDRLTGGSDLILRVLRGQEMFFIFVPEVLGGLQNHPRIHIQMG